MMVLLDHAALTSIALFSTWTAVQDQVKGFMQVFLLLETGMLGVFISLDLVLFYIFWEFTLIPMYFLIGVWGGERRLYASFKFFLFTMAGSVIMLLAILYMGLTARTFDWTVLTGLWALFAPAQIWLFLAFALAFAIKVPMFPLHTWLPDAHVEAPTAGSVILAGVLLKMGAYGFLRFNLPLVPAGGCPTGTLDGRAGCDRHYLWRSGGFRPEGCQETGGLFIRQPHGICHAGHLRLHPAGAFRQRAADGQPWHQHRRTVPDRRNVV